MVILLTHLLVKQVKNQQLNIPMSYKRYSVNLQIGWRSQVDPHLPIPPGEGVSVDVYAVRDF